MILLAGASRGRARAAQITFADQPMVTVGGTPYPSLVAWRFSSGAPTAAWLLNLSADPALVVDGLASLEHSAGTSSGNVTLPGFSIAVLGQ